MDSIQGHLRGDGTQVEGQLLKREKVEMLAEDREGQSICLECIFTHTFGLRMCLTKTFSLRFRKGR